MYAMVCLQLSSSEEAIFLECLGRAIRDCRWSMRLSQLAVAQRAEIERRALHEIENAIAEECTVETLRRIANALEVPAAYLMKQAEERMRFQSKR